MSHFAQMIDKLSDWTGEVFSFSLVALTVILVYEVMMRYAFNAPTIWAHELSGLLFVASGMFAGCYALYHKAHVNVDLLYARLSPRGRAIMDIITAPFMFVICWVLIWYGSKLALKSLRLLELSQSPWAPPLYPLKILIIVAVLMLAVQAFAKLIRDVYTAIGRRQ